MNPEKYKSTDINSVTKRTAEDTWNRDEKRNKEIELQGFKHLIIWESEVNHSPEQTLNKCLSFIKEHCLESIIGV
jgi:very-short-patch-repair endonuclease